MPCSEDWAKTGPVGTDWARSGDQWEPMEQISLGENGPIRPEHNIRVVLVNGEKIISDILLFTQGIKTD